MPARDGAGSAGAHGPAVDPAVARVLFGTAEAVPAPVPLRAGPLDLEWQGGRLRHLRVGGVEVWHAVAWPCRDPDWLTPEPVVTAARHRASRDGFHLVLRGHYPLEPGIAWRLAVVGTAAGEVRVALEAVPAGDTAVNRLGLCLLHPMTAAGARVEESRRRSRARSTCSGARWTGPGWRSTSSRRAGVTKRPPIASSASC